MSSTTPRPERARGSPRVPSRESMATVTAKPIPLTTKAGVTPKRAITSPPRPGPTMRAALNDAELSATALATSPRPTISATKDCRDGCSSTLTSPLMKASTATCQYSTRPDATRAARIRARQPRAVWVHMRSRRLGRRSARAPEAMEKSRMGANWREPMSPSLNGDGVSWSTSHDCATVCIHDPVCATN